ncbi:hypothetical protein D9613_002381 [Agrocybe pediades]|uniref:Secreted protein n=1 Tax=Agrocybe pediades TaxID=84607 RepID=A0A8H4R5C3_9AGAR|nr:hypothetical protein D9613_002381 [Agrocybe pediades]
MKAFTSFVLVAITSLFTGVASAPLPAEEGILPAGLLSGLPVVSPLLSSVLRRQVGPNGGVLTAGEQTANDALGDVLARQVAADSGAITGLEGLVNGLLGAGL